MYSIATLLHYTSLHLTAHQFTALDLPLEVSGGSFDPDLTTGWMVNTLHNQHFTLFTLYFTLYSLHITYYTVQCTLYTVHCIQSVEFPEHPAPP